MEVLTKVLRKIGLWKAAIKLESWFFSIPYIADAVQSSYKSGVHDGSGKESLDKLNGEILSLISRIGNLSMTEIKIKDDEVEKRAKSMLDALLSNVDLTHVIRMDEKGLVYLVGKQATKEELLNLKAEAEFLTQSNLWKILSHTPKELAQRAMFKDGGLENFNKGRSMMYFLSVQENVIDTLKRVK